MGVVASGVAPSNVVVASPRSRRRRFPASAPESLVVLVGGHPAVQRAVAMPRMKLRRRTEDLMARPLFHVTSTRAPHLCLAERSTRSFRLLTVSTPRRSHRARASNPLSGKKSNSRAQPFSSRPMIPIWPPHFPPTPTSTMTTSPPSASTSAVPRVRPADQRPRSPRPCAACGAMIEIAPLRERGLAFAPPTPLLFALVSAAVLAFRHRSWPRLRGRTSRRRSRGRRTCPARSPPPRSPNRPLSWVRTRRRRLASKRWQPRTTWSGSSAM